MGKSKKHAKPGTRSGFKKVPSVKQTSKSVSFRPPKSPSVMPMDTTPSEMDTTPSELPEAATPTTLPTEPSPTTVPTVPSRASSPSSNQNPNENSELDRKMPAKPSPKPKKSSKPPGAKSKKNPKTHGHQSSTGSKKSSESVSPSTVSTQASITAYYSKTPVPTTSEKPSPETPESLTVDVNRPITKSWHRVTQKMKLLSIEPFEMSVFKNPSSHLKIRELLGIFKALEVSKDPQGFPLDMDEIGYHAIDRDMSSGNPFFMADNLDASQVNRHKCLKILIRLARTPLSNLPSKVVGHNTLKDPSPLERLWYVAYELLGPVGSKPKEPPTPQPTVQSASRQLPNQTNNPQSASLTNPKSGSLTNPKSGSTNSPPRKKIKSKPLVPENKLGTTYFLFRGSPTQPFTAPNWEEGLPIALDFLKTICAQVWTVSPSARICSFPPKIGNRNNRPPTLDQNSEPSTYPKKFWDCLQYFRNCYISPGGFAPSGTLCVKHLGTSDELLHKLNELDQGFTFKLHPIQSMNITSVAWFGNSTPNTNGEDLAEAIRQHKLYKAMLTTHSNVQIYIQSGFIRLHQQEKVPVENRIYAMFLWTQQQYRQVVFDVLTAIYDSKKKTGFPLHRKYIVWPDTADSSSKASAITKQYLATARVRQGSYARSNATTELRDAISNPQASVYPGSPSLMDHLIGLQIIGPNATEPQPLFREINRSNLTDSCYVFSVDNDLKPTADEIINRLGMFCQDRWGPGIKDAFFDSSLYEQNLAFDTHQGQIFSKEDMGVVDQMNNLVRNNEWEN